MANQPRGKPGVKVARKTTMMERLSIRWGNLTLKQMGVAVAGFIVVIAVIAQVEKVSRESRLEDERNAPYIAKERLVAREEAARKAEADERWKTTESGRLCAEHPACAYSAEGGH